MTVYADVLFSLNACINYLMLLISARVAGAQIRRIRLAAAAALGGVYAVAALLPGCASLQSGRRRLPLAVWYTRWWGFWARV